MLIYGYSWYLDIVCPGWEALVKGDYDYIMPLTAGKKYGVNYLYPPFFTQQLGIFSSSSITETILDEFFNAIPEKFKYIEVNLNTANPFHGNGYTIKENLDHELDLNRSYELIRKGYSENTDRNVKKAAKHSFSISTDVPVENVITLFRNHRGKEISALKNRDYERLYTLVTHCLGLDKAKIYGVQAVPGGKLLAGAIFLNSDGRSIFIFSGLHNEGKKAGAMHVLIDHFIREHAGQKRILDFEGSNNKDLARFYKSFGSKECVYLQVRKNRLPKLLKWLKS